MASARQPGGLSAAELALVCEELQATLAGARVRDAVRLRESDDLLLFLAEDTRTRALWIAPGGGRGRICTTSQRFPKRAFATGPAAERPKQVLEGAELVSVTALAGERRAELRFSTRDGGELHLLVELFGPRGLWCLCDAAGRILCLSRPVSGRRDLRAGAVYVPPPPAPPRSDPPPRFARPCLEAIDRHYREHDRRTQLERTHARLQRALAAARTKLRRRLDELAAQRRNVAQARDVRRRADLLLSHGHLARPGQTRLRVPDPEREGEEVELELAPDRPFHVQAKELYQQARKLEASREVLAAREAATSRELEELDEALAALEARPGDPPTLERIHGLAVARGWLREPPPPPSTRRGPPRGKPDLRAAYRSFVSAEGLPILVGRSRADNDTLTLRVARGNDLWLHVGQGASGSHVVVRLPRGRTASLETLLDAATLAVHFSKARGRAECEVLYTQAKNVRKRKGQPPGMVTVTRERTLRVRHDPERLRRLLASGSA